MVSGWLDDRVPDCLWTGPGDLGTPIRLKKWAFGPLRALTGGRAGIVMQVRLLDDTLG